MIAVIVGVFGIVRKTIPTTIRTVTDVIVALDGCEFTWRMPPAEIQRVIC